MAENRANPAASVPDQAKLMALFPSPDGTAHIVVGWLAKLRWLAVAGQTIAALVAVEVLHLRIALGAIEFIIGLTACSNIVLYYWTTRRAPAWLVPAVLMLDVGLLTALLLCSGGRANPFSVLYLVHVAMAAVTLGEGGSWVVVGATAACYGLLYISPPLSPPLLLSPEQADAAQWIALSLVAILTAYFVGRITRSLRRHQQQLAEAHERASRNERLAALTTLAAGAAHELNTPLSTIAVAAKELELQAGQPSPEPALRQAFAADARLIRQEVNRCQFILGRMRVDVPAADDRVSVAISAREFEAELRHDLRPTASQALRVRWDGGLNALRLPALAVRQALAILIDNAVEASPAGKAVRLSIFQRDGHIVFDVSDEGEGMSPEVARRAGEPFFTTKPPGEGMGMGLFLVRLLAERLGGSFLLQSRPGEGTRATLELPAHQGENAAHGNGNTRGETGGHDRGKTGGGNNGGEDGSDKNPNPPRG